MDAAVHDSLRTCGRFVTIECTPAVNLRCQKASAFLKETKIPIEMSFIKKLK